MAQTRPLSYWPVGIIVAAGAIAWAALTEGGHGLLEQSAALAAILAGLVCLTATTSHRWSERLVRQAPYVLSLAVALRCEYVWRQPRPIASRTLAVATYAVVLAWATVLAGYTIAYRRHHP